MKKLDDKISVSDLSHIIRNLIAFIVVDGKEYVDENKRKAYVASYLQLLAKVIHNRQIKNDQEQIALVDDIAKDISKYVQ